MRMGAMRMGALLAMAGLLAVAACASPEPRYFTLATTPGTPSGGGPRSVMLRRPGLAGYLDRPELVRSGGTYQLNVVTGERWGEPFGDLFGRTLAEDLGRRLPGSSVYTESGSISADADATVEVDVQRFDAGPNGVVTLLMQASVHRGRGQRESPPASIRVTVPPATSSTGDVVAAMSSALGQAADQIATTLRALPAAPTSASRPGRRGQSRR